MDRRFVSIGAAFAFVGVACGAFGTHSLKDKLSSDMLTIWQTGSQYQLLHALALFALGAILTENSPKQLRISGWLFTAGICIFSGSLYLLAVTGEKKLGAITPIGGLCFLSAWALIAIYATKAKA